MILILTGNGKGKTTSALGQALRAAGWGKRVAIVFFDKGGNHYGEQRVLDKLKKEIDVYRFGLPRFNEKEGAFRFKNTDEDREQAKAGADKILELYKKKYFLIAADELINCLNLGLVSEECVRELIGQCPVRTHLMLTGRNAPDWLKKAADLASEIREVKHHFKKGGKAIKGIDY